MASDGERALGNALKAVRDVGDLDRRVAALQARMLAYDTELARLRRVEAAARAVRVGAAKMADRDGELPWWRHYRGEDWDAYCIACGAEAISTGGARTATLTHASDCAAMALDAALADDPGGTA